MVVMTDRAPAIGLEALPNEVLAAICEELEFQIWRAWMNSTSKRIHQATLPALYRDVHVYRDVSVDSLLIPRLSDQSPLVHTQTLRFGTRLSRPPAVLELLPLCGRRLQELEIGYFDTSESGLSHAEQMQLGTLLSPEITLHTLYINKLHDRALLDLLRRQTKLQCLSIHTVYETLDDRDFIGPDAFLQPGNGHLQSLAVIRFESRFEVTCVEHWIRNSSSTLETLYWSRTHSSPLAKAFSTPWPVFDNLTSLSVHGLTCSKLIAFWQSCPHLENLTFDHEHEHPTISVFKCEQLILLPSIPTFLHQLCVNSLVLRQKTIDALHKCLERMTELRELPAIYLTSDARSSEDDVSLEYERDCALDMLGGMGLRWIAEEKLEFMNIDG